MATEIETKFVFDTYQQICKSFDKTRTSIWKCVQTFLNEIPRGSTLLEIGCGNGKNMQYRKDIFPFGIDFVPNFVELCNKKGLNVIQGNALCLPFPDNSFDYAISIAVFHHLSTEERRIIALKEMNRIIKKGGKGLVVCWALDDKQGDSFIEWKDKEQNILGNRFYYFYSKSEFEKYAENVSLKKIYFEENNWVLEFEKVS